MSTMYSHRLARCFRPSYQYCKEVHASEARQCSALVELFEKDTSTPRRWICHSALEATAGISSIVLRMYVHFILSLAF